MGDREIILEDRHIYSLTDCRIPDDLNDDVISNIGEKKKPKLNLFGYYAH